MQRQDLGKQRVYYHPKFPNKAERTAQEICKFYIMLILTEKVSERLNWDNNIKSEIRFAVPWVKNKSQCNFEEIREIWLVIHKKFFGFSTHSLHQIYDGT